MQNSVASIHVDGIRRNSFVSIWINMLTKRKKMQKSNWIYSTHLNFPIFCASFYCAWVCIYTDTQTHTGKIWNTSKPPHWMTAIYKGKYLLNIYSLCFFYPASTIFASLTQAMPCKLEWSRKTQRKIEREVFRNTFFRWFITHTVSMHCYTYLIFLFIFPFGLVKKFPREKEGEKFLRKKRQAEKACTLVQKGTFEWNIII